MQGPPNWKGGKRGKLLVTGAQAWPEGQEEHSVVHVPPLQTVNAGQSAFVEHALPQ